MCVNSSWFLHVLLNDYPVSCISSQDMSISKSCTIITTHWCGKQNSAQIITVTAVSQMVSHWCNNPDCQDGVQRCLNWKPNPWKINFVFSVVVAIGTSDYVHVLSYNFPHWRGKQNSAQIITVTTQGYSTSWLRYNFFPKWCKYFTIADNSSDCLC